MLPPFPLCFLGMKIMEIKKEIRFVPVGIFMTQQMSSGRGRLDTPQSKRIGREVSCHCCYTSTQVSTTEFLVLRISGFLDTQTQRFGDKISFRLQLKGKGHLL
jgi:hypothetical protein